MLQIIYAFRMLFFYHILNKFFVILPLVDILNLLQFRFHMFHIAFRLTTLIYKLVHFIGSN
jgi:hypothetical protein